MQHGGCQDPSFCSATRRVSDPAFVILWSWAEGPALELAATLCPGPRHVLCFAGTKEGGPCPGLGQALSFGGRAAVECRPLPPAHGCRPQTLGQQAWTPPHHLCKGRRGLGRLRGPRCPHSLWLGWAGQGCGRGAGTRQGYFRSAAAVATRRHQSLMPWATRLPGDAQESRGASSGGRVTWPAPGSGPTWEGDPPWEGEIAGHRTAGPHPWVFRGVGLVCSELALCPPDAGG